MINTAPAKAQQVLQTLPTHNQKSEGEPSWSQSVKTGLCVKIFAETIFKYGDRKIKFWEIWRARRRQGRRKGRRRGIKGGRESDDTYTPAPAVCVQAQSPPSSETRPALQRNRQPNTTFNKPIKMCEDSQITVCKSPHLSEHSYYLAVPWFQGTPERMLILPHRFIDCSNEYWWHV